MKLSSSQLGDVYAHGTTGLEDTGYLWIASGYAVHNEKVILVLHNRFGLWVPPGGHLEPGEVLAKTAEREFREETGFNGKVVSAAPIIHPHDSNASPSASPFYTDIETEGFRKPAYVNFFYIKLEEPERFTLDRHEQRELDGIGLFGLEDLDGIPTFEQVRSLSRHAIRNHPSPTAST